MKIAAAAVSIACANDFERKCYQLRIEENTDIVQMLSKMLAMHLFLGSAIAHTACQTNCSWTALKAI